MNDSVCSHHVSRRPKFTRYVAYAILFARLCGAQIHAESLISESNLSGEKGETLPFTFDIPEGVYSIYLNVTGPGTGPITKIEFSIGNEFAVGVDALIVERTGTRQYRIDGVFDGEWDLDLTGLTKFSGIGFSVDPVPADGVTRVPDLPGIMDRKGWLKGAKLLRHWLDSTGTDDTTTATMAWALQFPLCKSKYDYIFKKKVYMNKAARELLVEKLANRPAGEYTMYANYVKDLGKYLGIARGNIDEFDIAIHAFRLDIEVTFDYAAPDERGNRYVYIKKVGVSLHDTFEFGEDGEIRNQPLGRWNKKTDYVGTNVRVEAYSFFNSNFRDYTKKTGRGKNFLIVSDTLWKTLEKPQRFFSNHVDK